MLPPRLAEVAYLPWKVGLENFKCRMRFGRGWNLSFRSLKEAQRAVGRRFAGFERLPTASSINCERAASGMRCLASLARAVQSIATFRSGSKAVSLPTFGALLLRNTTNCAASNGIINRSILRASRHLSVGKKTGPSPTDRGKLGSKRSIIVDGRGVPIGFELAAANVNDDKVAFETIDSIPVPRPRTRVRRRQHFHADKGYDQKVTRTRLKMRRYIAHVRKKRRRDRRGRPVTKRDGHRWRVEAAHSWSNRFRGLKTRWEKKADNHAALAQLSFALIALRILGVLG